MTAGGAAAPWGEHASASRCRDIFPLPPLPKKTSPCTSKSSRVRGRVRRLQRAQDLASSAIDALNSLYAAPSGSGRCRDPLPSLCSTHVAEVHQYIFDCCYEFAGTPESFDESASHLQLEAETEAYDDFNSGGPTKLISDMVALPTNGGKFPVADYVGPDLAAYAHAEPPACDEGDMVSQLLARTARSCHRIAPQEYAALVARMCKGNMAELFPSPADFILGLFGAWKVVGKSQRLLVDARPPNCLFGTPRFVHTGGDSLARMQVAPDHDLEVAKADLKNYYHSCEAPQPLRRFFGLRRVKASRLRAAGLDVPRSAVDSRGYCWPRLTTIPMGFSPAPGLSQGAHESILYGEKGEGSEKARSMPAVLDPAARWSSESVPELDSEAATTPHALVVDDLLLFRQKKRTRRRRRQARVSTEQSVGLDPAEHDSRLSDACARYAEVGLEAHPDKVFDFSTDQDLLGYRLERNVLRAQTGRYEQLRAWVRSLECRGWAKAREVERLVGKLTHLFLIQRFALSTFAAVYAFAQKCGHRRARLWPSVLRELRTAVALVPLVRSDLTRPVAELLLQTDASNNGTGVVYTRDIPHRELRRECMRPRSEPRDPDNRWEVERAWSTAFEAPLDPAAWRVAVRRRLRGPARAAHINDKELGATVDAVRWAVRSSATRRCRIVVQSDSTAAVGALRKGRSSRRPLLRHCRRMAAITLAEQLTVESRWTPTTKNFADGPSRGRGPAPCGDDLDGIYEGVNLSRRDRRALGQFAAEMQRRRMVDDFETALAAGDISDSKVPFMLQGIF